MIYDLNSIGINAKSASVFLRKASVVIKNNALISAGEALINNIDAILAANKKDVEAATEFGIKGSLIDRLLLNEARIKDMADSFFQIAAFDDPCKEVSSMKTLPNGLIVGKKTTPIGVIGIIYEARPNVTADAFALCFKSGNVVILRGGKEAINSNMEIVKILQDALEKCNIPKYCVQLIEDTSRDVAKEFMRLNEYIDVLIPRGGHGLIQTVIENSNIPVIETGTGNCHIFVDETADLESALDIVFNAKTQRPGVCNACETLLVHKKIAEDFLPNDYNKLKEKNVEIRADETAYNILSALGFDIIKASDDDWAKEFLDYIIAVKVISDIDCAIEHINKYSTGHSECIITENYSNSQKFLDEVDSAAVYVNASTRFTDGVQFGLGAEIGISTQKLHARGPMGLKELTTTKYIIYGSGQIR